MTYCIFSLTSGSVLESYTSPERAFEAAARILDSEPQALASFAVVEFDHRDIVGSYEGEDLRERAMPYLLAREEQRAAEVEHHLTA
jgi:hypothetical protein